MLIAKEPIIELVDWPVWDQSIHETPDQITRQINSREESLIPLEVNERDGICYFRGSAQKPYRTTLHSCTCFDFTRRKLPCKHMYRLASRIGKVRVRPTWGGWNPSLHKKDWAQGVRQYRACTQEMAIESLDETSEAAIIEGYHVSLNSCSCRDFQARHLPCKHIYWLARRLGIIEISDKDFAKYVELEGQSDEPFDDRQAIHQGVTYEYSPESVTLDGAILRLKDVIENEGKRLTAPERFLVRFQDGFSVGWRMCLPEAFKPALDIVLRSRIVNKSKVQIWTQGSLFGFSDGDILYDTRAAYQDWSEAMKHLKICVQVISSTPVTPRTIIVPPDLNRKDKADAAARLMIVPRDPGEVTFRILTPNPECTELVDRGEHTSNQDQFVGMLIMGPPAEWLEDTV